jgi:5-methylcytosine-specific restriction endonuclease McrA
MRICSGAGCLRAVKDEMRFCDECAPVVVVDDARNHTSGYDAELDGLRNCRRLRIQIIHRDPLCSRCQLSISEIVDHVVPAREAISQAQLSRRYPTDRYAGYYLKSNLQGLCRPCHYAKTLEDKTHTGAWPDVVENDRLTPKRVWSF